jgi:hypothetical protein
VGVVGGKHCPHRCQTLAIARILRRAPCLRHTDVHADEAGNKYVGPLGYPFFLIWIGIVLVYAIQSKLTESDDF